MAGRKFLGSRQRKNKPNLIWAASVIVPNTPLAAGAFDQTILIEGADFQGGDTGSMKVTTQRVIGYLSFVINSAVDTAMNAVILKMDENDLATGDFDPVAPATYVDEDVLWSHGIQWEASSITHETVRIDIPTKRVIKRGQQLRLIIKPTGGPILMTGVIRVLARRN